MSKVNLNKDLHLVSNFKVKGLTEDDDEDIIIEGYANTTDKDRGGDVILSSAWEKGGLDNYVKNPILLAYHDYKQPIGKTTEHSITGNGLHITGKISKAAGDVYDLVKAGILQAFSVGFKVKDADYDADTDIFIIKELELHEISVVSVGMNQNSLFSVRKSFDNQEDYNEFKSSFINVDTKSTNTEGDTTVPDTNKKDVIEITPEQLQAQMDEAISKAFADAKEKSDADDAAKAIAIQAGKDGATDLLKEVEARLSEEKSDMLKSIEDLKAELKDRSTEIQAMTASKMSFEDKDSRKLTDMEMDTAYLIAKMVNKKVEDTDYFKNNLIQKVGDHLASATAYENIYSTRMYDAIQDKLVIEPLFSGNKIQMTSRSMTFPFNPQAGYANWVHEGDYKSTLTEAQQAEDGVDNSSSSGTAQTHLITTIDLKAEKLASKEVIGYEEEEDSIIPILPIVRNAIAKRMARTTDIELLRADEGQISETKILAAPTGFNGVATMGSDDSAVHTQAGAYGTTNPITVADLQSTRRLMGSYGLNPNDVVYVVCESAYWDLLEDPDFRTMDLVGEKATILRGQIGAVNGSPVVVSDSFAAPAIGGYAAIALNTSNYLFGELRGLTTERDKDILNQKNWIVTTRRFAFNEIAAGTAVLNSCAVCKYPAA